MIVVVRLSEDSNLIVPSWLLTNHLNERVGGLGESPRAAVADSGTQWIQGVALSYAGPGQLCNVEVSKGFPFPWIKNETAR